MATRTRTPEANDAALTAAIDQAIMAARERRHHGGYDDGLPAPNIRRAIRVGAGLSGRDLAGIVGVTHERIYAWENGANPGTRDRCDTYARVLCILGRRQKGTH